MKKTTLLLIALMINLPALAQPQKIGHVDLAGILMAMPEREAVEASLHEYRQGLYEAYQGKQQEFQARLNDYRLNAQGMSPGDRQQAQQQLNDLRNRLQGFQARAEQAIDARRSELQAPVMAKLKQALSAVAQTQGYSYVLSKDGSVLVFDPQHDLTEQVRQQLR